MSIKTILNSFIPRPRPLPEISFPFLWRDSEGRVFIRSRREFIRQFPHPRDGYRTSRTMDLKLTRKDCGEAGRFQFERPVLTDEQAWDRRLRGDESLTLSNEDCI